MSATGCRRHWDAYVWQIRRALQRELDALADWRTFLPSLFPLFVCFIDSFSFLPFFPSFFLLLPVFGLLLSADIGLDHPDTVLIYLRD